MLKENRGIRCSFTAYRPICLPSIVFSWKEIRERGSRSPVCRWICSPDATDRRQGTARNHKSWDRRGGSGATGLGTFSGARPAQRSATPPTNERGVRRGRAGWRPFRVTRRPVRQCRYHRRVPRSPSSSLWVFSALAGLWATFAIRIRFRRPQSWNRQQASWREADNPGLTDRAHPRRDPFWWSLCAYRKAVADLNPAAVFHRTGRDELSGVHERQPGHDV
jgi:hypothetical protein